MYLLNWLHLCEPWNVILCVLRLSTEVKAKGQNRQKHTPEERLIIPTEARKYTRPFYVCRLYYIPYSVTHSPSLNV